MSDDIIIQNADYSSGPIFNDASEFLAARAGASRRFVKISSRPDADNIRDRLSSVREYLADNRPDPQWEKLKVVLNILLDIFWIVASMAVFHLTDFYVRVLYDRKMDRDWLLYSGIAFSIDLLIAGYYIIYLTCIRSVSPAHWDSHWRWGFPIATVLFFAGSIAFVVAAWNVWWIFSPFMIFLFFMGFITVVSYIPDFGAGGTPDDLETIDQRLMRGVDDDVGNKRRKKTQSSKHRHETKLM